MEQLLSTTSDNWDNHTQLATILGGAPTVDCEKMRLTTVEAIDTYFDTVEVDFSRHDEGLHSDPKIIPKHEEIDELKLALKSRVKRFADVVFEKSEIYLGFLNHPGKPRHPRRNSLLHSHSVFASQHPLTEDESLKRIFESIPEVVQYTEGFNFGYLFKIATIEADVFMITEIVRKDPQGPLNTKLINPHVSYDLSFAGFGS